MKLLLSNHLLYEYASFRQRICFCFLYNFALIQRCFLERYRFLHLLTCLSEAKQNKSDVTNRFRVRELLLAVYVCLIRKCDRFEAIVDFRWSKKGGVQFPIDGGTAEQK
jgi:hypothetical protein